MGVIHGSLQTTLQPNLEDKAIDHQRSHYLLPTAGLALLLASVRVYGVLAFNVGRRSREIGIRIALGASPKYVIGNVFFRGFTLVFPGLVLGLLGAWALGRYIESQLYGVTVTDPLTYAIGSLTLLLSAVLACWIPARRAARIDPMEALRYE